MDDSCCKIQNQESSPYSKRVVLKSSPHEVEWKATLHLKSTGKKIKKASGFVKVDSSNLLERFEQQARNEGIMQLNIFEEELLQKKPFIVFE